MLIRHNITAPYGLLFLSDGCSRQDVPGDTSAANVTYGDKAIAFWVIHEVDGAALIELTDDVNFNNRGLKKIFEGKLIIESKIVSISQPDYTKIASIEIAVSDPKIHIYTNDPINPDHIVVYVSC